MEYDVVIWRDTLSDGSICYAAICPAVAYAHGQGDTEEEALVDVADTMAFFRGKCLAGSKPIRLLRTHCPKRSLN